MSLTVYGIPTCDTVRRARRWLDDHGAAHAWVDLRQTPPDRATLHSWVTAVGSKALRNTSGRSYRALGADKASWTDHQWVDAFATDPMLLKRPIIERDGDIVLVGFKAPEDALRSALLATRPRAPG